MKTLKEKWLDASVVIWGIISLILLMYLIIWGITLIAPSTSEINRKRVEQIKYCQENGLSVERNGMGGYLCAVK